MALLHIYDSSDWTIRLTAGRRGAAHTLACPDVRTLIAGLDGFVKVATTFDRILFETHGNSGLIGFGPDDVNAATLRSWIPRHYGNITTANARVYFNGCNVGEGADGWRFLTAAAALFLSPGGGDVFSHTSAGLANPVNGHTVHFWGETRHLKVDASGQGYFEVDF